MSQLITLRQLGGGGAGTKPASLTTAEMAVNTLDGRLYANSGIELMALPMQAIYLTSNLAQIKGTSLAAVPTLNMTGLANASKWKIVWDLIGLMSTTTGTFGCGVAATAGSATGQFGVNGILGAVGTGAGVYKQGGAALAATTIANTTFGNTGFTTAVNWVRVWAAVTITAANTTISMQISTSGASIGFTPQAGSYLMAYRLG